MASNKELTKPSSTQESLMEKLLEFRRKFYEENKKQAERSTEKLIYDKIKKVQDLDKVLNNVETSDKLYPKFAAMQGYFLIETSIEAHRMGKSLICNPPTYLSKCQKLLEPLKYRPEAIWLYNKCLFVYTEMLVCSAKPYLKIKTLEESKAVCEKYFQSTNEKPWDLNDIFEYYTDDGKQVVYASAMNLRQQYNLVLKHLLEIGIISSDHTLVFKYGMPGLKASLDEDSEILTKKILAVSAVLFERHYYKQVNHLLSLAMHKMVEYRRLLPEFLRNCCDELQSAISFMYAVYGCVLLGVSLAKMSGKTLFEIQEKFQKLEESAGLKVYEDQFPVDLVSDKKKLKSIFKKAKLWLERALELKKENSDLIKEAENIRECLDLARDAIDAVHVEQFMDGLLKKYDFSNSNF